MLLVDSSGSMTSAAGMRSKWETARSALRLFVSDPKSAGLSVALQFFPAVKPCTTDKDCVASAVGEGRFCLSRQVCASEAAPEPGARTCGGGGIVISPIGPIGGGGGCPMGTSCRALGSCSMSADLCTNLGQPCPMGAGTCEAAPRSCQVGGSAVECEDARYEAPAVGFAALPAASLAVTRALHLKEPTGGTPMGPAVRGTLAHLRAQLAANPGRKVALILVSDGLPGACQRNDIPAVVADLGTAFTGTPSIPSYVIGVFSPNEVTRAEMALNQLAMAGGTNQAFLLTANDDLNARLLEALNQIRGAVLACEYKIPEARMGGLDLGKVNVRYTGGAGAENVGYVERAERCDPMRGGWYYDVHPSQGTPSRILVCEATCARFKAEQNAKVELVFGCATQVIN